MSKSRWSVVIMMVLIAVFAMSCKKKVKALPPPPPEAEVRNVPPPPPPTRPSILAFSVEPTTIEPGQSATLRWNVSGATSISIDQGIGHVSPTDTHTVTPRESTTYTLTAVGPSGGQSTATATVTVTSAAPPPPSTTPTLSLDERISRQVQDIYFDYDQFTVRDDARGVMATNAVALKSIFHDYPSATVIIEGHCDERGSAEYNLGLGDKRASATRDYLVQLGVPIDKLKSVSYGKERPVCNEANESCYQKNRRAHFAAAQ